MDVIWQYKSAIAAAVIAVVYFFLIRPRLKAGLKIEEAAPPVYVCDDCGETDCVCHKLEDAEEP